MCFYVFYVPTEVLLYSKCKLHAKEKFLSPFGTKFFYSTDVYLAHYLFLILIPDHISLKKKMFICSNAGDGWEDEDQHERGLSKDTTKEEDGALLLSYLICFEFY